MPVPRPLNITRRKNAPDKFDVFSHSTARSPAGNTFYEHIAKLNAGAVANVYLNPGHGMNYRSKVLYPDATAGTALLLESQWDIVFDIAAAPTATSPYKNNGQTNFSVIATPFVEFPFAILRGDGVLVGVPNPSCQAADGGVHTFMKDRHVYGYRCIGKSSTSTERGPRITSNGQVKSIRKPKDCDVNAMDITDSPALGGGTNSRCLQRLPGSSADLSKIPGAKIAPAWDGVYAVSHHENMDFTYRDVAWHKISNGYPNTLDPAHNQSCMTWSRMSDGVVGYAVNGTNTGLKCPVSHWDNTDVCVSVFESVSGTTSFNIKFTAVHELLLKASSPDWNRAQLRPMFSPQLCDILKQYENVRAGMEGGGILIASDNAVATIWDQFKNFLGGVRDKIAGVIPALIGHATHAADSLLGKIGQAASFLGPMLPSLIAAL